MLPTYVRNVWICMLLTYIHICDTLATVNWQLRVEPMVEWWWLVLFLLHSDGCLTCRVDQARTVHFVNLPTCGVYCVCVGRVVGPCVERAAEKSGHHQRRFKYVYYTCYTCTGSDNGNDEQAFFLDFATIEIALSGHSKNSSFVNQCVRMCHFNCPIPYVVY